MRDESRFNTNLFDGLREATSPLPLSLPDLGEHLARTKGYCSSLTITALLAGTLAPTPKMTLDRHCIHRPRHTFDFFFPPSKGDVFVDLLKKKGFRTFLPKETTGEYHPDMAMDVFPYLSARHITAVSRLFHDRSKIYVQVAEAERFTSQVPILCVHGNRDAALTFELEIPCGSSLRFDYDSHQPVQGVHLAILGRSEEIVFNHSRPVRTPGLYLH